jgi:hypothetical protein
MRKRPWRGHKADPPSGRWAAGNGGFFFAVEGRPELGRIIHNPATLNDAERLRMLLDKPISRSVPACTRRDDP